MMRCSKWTSWHHQSNLFHCSNLSLLDGKALMEEIGQFLLHIPTVDVTKAIVFRYSETCIDSI